MADIYTSMACIMADIDAVGKNQKNQQQGFKFRGIGGCNIVCVNGNLLC
jgi:hypothetical protein